MGISRCKTEYIKAFAGYAHLRSAAGFDLSAAELFSGDILRCKSVRSFEQPVKRIYLPDAVM